LNSIKSSAIVTTEEPVLSFSTPTQIVTPDNPVSSFNSPTIDGPATSFDNSSSIVAYDNPVTSFDTPTPMVTFDTSVSITDSTNHDGPSRTITTSRVNDIANNSPNRDLMKRGVELLREELVHDALIYNQMGVELRAKRQK
jgi:hypothetical protein